MEQVTPAPAPAPKHTRIDVLHKVVFPLITITIAICSVCAYVHFNREHADQKREIAELKQKEEARETRHQNEIRQEAEIAQQQRVAMYKGFLNKDYNLSNSPMEEKAKPEIRSWFGAMILTLRGQDEQRYGPAVAKEMWEKAKEQAAKEMKPGFFPWSDGTW